MLADSFSCCSSDVTCCLLMMPGFYSVGLVFGKTSGLHELLSSIVYCQF